jgi:hypothetical protein
MIHARLRIENLIYYTIHRDNMETADTLFDGSDAHLISDDTKECFGEKCKGCKNFYGCTEHFPYGCWGDDE